MKIQSIKNLLILILFLQSILFANKINAQATINGIFFQAVARDLYNNPAKDRKIYVQSNIIQSTATGKIMLTEIHQTSTDGLGIFSLSVGQGARVGGAATSLKNIDWSIGAYYLNLKVAITPFAPASGWDFNKEWIDMGTTPFGTVPFAFYSLSSGGLEEKLNKSDTSKMLAPYIKVVDSGVVYVTPVQLKGVKFDTTSLSRRVDAKLNAADTIKYTKQTYSDSALVAKQVLIGLKLNAADTSKYTKQTYTDSSLLTKLKISDTTTMLSSRIARDTLSLSNRINTKANTTDVTTSLALKENISNKSTAVDLGGTSPSDVLFPTQKAVKDYVLANNASGGIADGGITTIKLADGAVTDAKINTVSGSKVIGNITGNAATATLATNATTAGNITATSNTTLTTLSSLTSVGTLANLTVTNPIAGSITGNAATTTKLATARNINGALFDGSADILIPAKFTNDVTIKLSGSNSLGKYANGATIPTAGKTLDEFLYDLVTQSIAPTYTAPTVSISSDKSASYEIGTNIGTVTLSKSFTQNNGGSLLSTTYYKDNVSLVSASTNSPGVLSTSISYSVTVTYGQGPVLNNNLGTPDATGQIPAGSKSSSLTISPFAYKYWGSSTLNSIDDATLRAGTNENSGKAKSSFTVPISGTKYIFYAYPASLGVLSSISVGGFDSFETFTLTTRDVTNASGYTQSYNIYISNNKFSTDVNSIIIN